MVVYQKYANNHGVAKILDAEGDRITITIYIKKGSRFIETQNTTYIVVTRCCPGGFRLSLGGFLPKNIKERLATDKIIIY